MEGQEEASSLDLFSGEALGQEVQGALWEARAVLVAAPEVVALEALEVMAEVSEEAVAALEALAAAEEASVEAAVDANSLIIKQIA